MNDLDDLMDAVERMAAAVNANTAVLERIEPLLARWVAADEAMAQLAGALMPDAEPIDAASLDWRNDGRGGYLVCAAGDCRPVTGDEAAAIRASIKPTGSRKGRR